MNAKLCAGICAGIAGAAGGAGWIVKNRRVKKIVVKAKQNIADAVADTEEKRARLYSLLARSGQQRLFISTHRLGRFLKTFQILEQVDYAGLTRMLTDELKETDHATRLEHYIDEFEMANIRNFNPELIQQIETVRKFAAAQDEPGRECRVVAGAYGIDNTIALIRSDRFNTVLVDEACRQIVVQNIVLFWLSGGEEIDPGDTISELKDLCATGFSSPLIPKQLSVLSVSSGTGNLFLQPDPVTIAGAQKMRRQAGAYIKETRGQGENLEEVLNSTLSHWKALHSFSWRMNRAEKALNAQIEQAGGNYHGYSDEQKRTVYTAVKYAVMVHHLISLRLLSESRGCPKQTSLFVSSISTNKIFRRINKTIERRIKELDAKEN